MINHKFITNDIIQSLPKEPGIYRYYNIDDELIYVGKAKNLKNRVSSYFQSSAIHNRKTTRMIAQIARLDFMVVNTEYDALHLENALIKKHQPKYNILLKDDKTYPYICLLNEPFPRIIPIRRIDKTKGEYFGPYSNVGIMHSLIDFLRKTFHLRTCSLALTQNNIQQHKFKICLEHHIGNCLGPCEALQNEEDYRDNITQIRKILKGDISIVIKELQKQMNEQADKLQFEKAHIIKERIDKLEQFQTKSIVSNPNLNELDIFTAVEDEHSVYVNYMYVVKGTIVASKNFQVKNTLSEPLNEILAQIIYRVKEETGSRAKEIISNIEVSLETNHIVNNPQIGDKKKLIDLSLKNILLYKHTREPDKKDKHLVLLEKIKEDLNLSKLPVRAECFDNSNIQGTNPVASMVCFINGKPAKKEYRHFKIKTVIGPDDFGSMYEIVSRRYSRLKAENIPYPDLIIIDGGKGQLSSAVQALKDVGVYGEIPIVSIAKRLEEVFYPNDELPLFISKKSPTIKFIQHIRDEAHRFAITFHRQLRSKNFIKHEIATIEGIGKSTIDKIYKEFKTTKLEELDYEKLVSVIGKDKTNKIWAKKRVTNATLFFIFS